MAGGKLPPRQKMIGMMYLVLTALLAMNVSKDILDAFIIVNDGLEKTANTFEGKNAALYNEFAKSYQENQKKVGPWYDKAKKVKSAADDLFQHLTMVKANIIYQTEGLESIDNAYGPDENQNDTTLNLKNINSKDNYDVPTHILIGGEPSSPKEGEYTANELKLKLEAYRDALLEYAKDNPSLTASLKNTFNFENKKDASGVDNSWETYNFDHVPLAATLTILSKLQTDVRNAESDVVNHLFANVSAADFKFNQLSAAIIPQSSYVVQNDTFRAQVFIAAYDDTYNPEMLLGDQMDTVTNQLIGESTPIDVRNGKGYISIKADREGEFTRYGIINYKGPSGNIVPYPFQTTYTVAKPSLVVSADKMNVFYKGVENPVSISVPGVSSDKLSVSISPGSIRKSPKGGYVVNIKTGTKATISVMAEMPDGSKKPMGKQEFRVKTIPNPVPYVAQQTGSGNVRLVQLKATNKIFAKMENFDFELQPQILGYTFSMSLSGGVLVEEKINGDRITGKAKELIQSQLKKNNRVYFENILVKMPDGSTRTIGPVILKAT
jgi:gliding motility-associated protein GldM